MLRMALSIPRVTRAFQDYSAGKLDQLPAGLLKSTNFGNGPLTLPSISARLPGQ